MEKLQKWSLVLGAVLGFTVACHGTERLRSLEEAEVPPVPEFTVIGTPDGGVPDGGVPDGGVPDDDAPLDYTPAETNAGVPGPQKTLDGGWVYRDLGEADEEAELRGLISFPIRNRAALDARIREIYDPASPRFRQYYPVAEWMEEHAPPEKHLDVVADWMESQGLAVPRRATNRLFLQFTGTVKQFNDAFGVKVRLLERKAPQAGNPPHPVYGLVEPIKAPQFVKERIHAVVALDLAADTTALQPEGGQVEPFPDDEIAGALTPEQVAHAYGFMPLYQRGHRGAGVRLGVAVGAMFRYRDLHAFWKQFDVQRADPVVIQTMEPPATRYKEAQLDIEWASVMAPEAEVRVYMGPDARNTSMIFTYNEAIARNEIDVLTDSFAHREDSEPVAVREAYDNSSAMAAALGITVVAASGDSAGVDTPSCSPYVTAVGGTELLMSGNSIYLERAWPQSGSGISRTFTTPWWQEGVHPELMGMRGVADVALNAKNGYWITYLNRWTSLNGTSFSSPVFAGMIAVINGARMAEGKPRLGFLNQTLYTSPAVQGTFRDITDWATPKYSAGPGWDFPTGWGAPDAERLYQTLP
jgi:kumamolisin